ncbi:glutathione hydrolase 7-like isoform X2 [Lycorma delicatula]|uniref:glutathione hydrolase 7-like isoform X2 n=1 Tax=Lycorma delicatula TaxID=130591 RepID=UPI003F513F2E
MKIRTPYLSADRSELAPLYNNPQETKGLRTTATFFSIFSIFVAIALAIQLHYGDYQVVAHGSITTDSYNCSVVGAVIIKKGGNAVDAAVASAFCMGVVHPHLTGLGGGGLMIIYDQRQRKLKDCIDFRVLKSLSSVVGVPGFLAGLYQAHNHHGILSWKQIIAPSINIARSGFLVSDNLLLAKASLVGNSSDLYSWLTPLQQNQLITNDGLADTLEAIANNGPDVFYNGNLTQQLVSNGNLSPSDLAGYHVLRGLTGGLCVEHIYNGYKVVLTGHGSGGPLVLKTMDLLNLTLPSDTPIATVGSALIHGNNSEESWPLHSGSIIVTTDRSDLYVSVVSGLGSVLGSQQLLSGGFILNNALELGTLTSDDRVTSLSVPFIAVEVKHVCGRRLISGAPDARDAVQLLYRLISSSSPFSPFNSTDIELVVEAPRVRFTSSKLENQVWLENKLRPSSPFPSTPSKEELASIEKEGFQIFEARSPYPSLNVMQKINDVINAHADSRGGGAYITF